MLRPGCYPAAVTPMLPSGEIDQPGMARLLAWFESKGCAGAVIAGTNGEGPSLAAVEKRDLLRAMIPVRGKLDLILGIATPSISEALWSCSQAAKAGAAAALVMPPSYFREATPQGLHDWFERLLDGAGLPILIYNFPQRTGITLDGEFLSQFAQHPNLAGAKDSSGSAENLQGYARALPGKALFVGNETLLIQALQEGWTGTISGAANVVTTWLAQVVELWHSGNHDRAQLKFQMVFPALEAIRKMPQPAANKAMLAKLGIIDSPAVRLPLTTMDDQGALAALQSVTATVPI